MKGMAKRWAAIVLLLLSFCRALRAEEPALRDARVTDAVGQVTLQTADNPKQPVILDDETPLEAGDAIVTGLKSNAEITFNGETVFKLQPGSHLTLQKIFLNNTQLELSQGAMLAKVKPAATPDQSLIIKMPTAVVAIRGTEFGVETGGGVAHVGVFDEGHIAVQGAWGHEHVLLAPNQETKVTLSNVPQTPRPLAHFQAYRQQMAPLRSRAAYWHSHWKPIPPEKKQAIRQGLYSPQRKTSPGFKHPWNQLSAKTAAHKVHRKAARTKKKKSNPTRPRHKTKPKPSKEQTLQKDGP